MSVLNDRWGEEVMKFGFTGIPNLLLLINSLKETKGPERITGSELFVLLVILSQWINPRSQPRPSIQRIARYTGLSNRHVRRVIKDLANKNYLVPQRHGELDGRWNSYSLRPLIDKLSLAAEALDAEMKSALADESVTRLEIADRLGLFSGAAS